MYAIIRHGSSQFRVAPGDRITVRGESYQAGQAVEFPDVLAVGGEGTFRQGKDCAGLKVTGEVVRAARSPKILVQHFRRRKNYKKLRGHRQGEALVRIKEIPS
jgi:large subunit ribosomal protein L21